MQGFKQFFVEVSKQDIKNIEDRVSDALSHDRGNLPFSDIFGNKLRMVVPYNSNIGDISRIEELLKKNGYKDVDFAKKTAKREVATRQGNKDMEVSIGKALSQLKDPSAKALLDKFSAMAPVTKGDNVMVISRHPVDVLRMSNHGWTSCHSPGGSVYGGRSSAGAYYQCAVQEAKSGGAIAYVVKKRDLNGVDLQSDEIFEDRDRGVSGISPLGRVRLRKIDFTGGGDYKELLVPSNYGYGTVPDGTVETLKDWAKGVQGDTLSVVKDYLLNTKDGHKSLELRGGSYQDRGDSASEILSGLYGDMSSIGKIKHSPDDEEEEGKENVEEIDRRMQQSIRDHDFNNISASASAEDYDGPAYLMYDVYVTFSFPVTSFGDIPSTSDRDLVKDIKDAVDFYSVSDFSIENDKENVNINISFHDEDSNNTFIGFEHYMDYAKRDLDDKYDSIKNKIQNIFISSGYFINPMDSVKLKNLKKDSDGDYGFTYKFGDIHGLPNILFGDKDYPAYGLSKEIGYFVAPVGRSLDKSFDEYRVLHKINGISGIDSKISMQPEDQPEAIAVRGAVGLKDMEPKPISGHGALSVNIYLEYDKDESSNWNIENIKKFDEAVPELTKQVNNWWHGIVDDINKLWKSKSGS